MGRVREEVFEITGQAQSPIEENRLTKPVYLAGQDLNSNDINNTSSISTNTNTPAENIFWQSIANSRLCGDYQAYLSAYPHGNYVGLAKVRIAVYCKQETESEQQTNPSSEESRKRFEPEMVQVPGGCFVMGSPLTEQGRYDDETLHRVCVEGFEIGKYEVTQAQWKAIMGDNPSYFKDDQNPVEEVSLHDIQKYIHALNEKTSKKYRLPTEAEWEYAARGGSSSAYPWGDTINHDQANYGHDECCSGVIEGHDQWEYTSPVGSFSANDFGLYDTVGNVNEWTCSLYNFSYDGKEKKCVSLQVGGNRVIRGGSWIVDPAWVRSAIRSSIEPTDKHIFVGFRLVRTN